ncbi:hypothetical protein B0H17DRAFT_877299, partial [Mycena rosella]
IYGKVNVKTTHHLLDARLAHGVRKLVCMSQPDTVWDGSERSMFTERTAVVKTTPWRKGTEFKVQGERLVLRADGTRDLRTAVIRLSSCLGSATPKVVGSQIGDNANLVDHANITNIVHALILAADRLPLSHPKHAAAAGRAFFITDGAPHPFFDFYRDMWAELAGEAPTPHTEDTFERRMTLFLSFVRGDPPEVRQKIRFVCTSRSYDITLAREVLDYVPIVSYEEGIRETVKVF